ncbi:unnamed protein product, partial [Effrenium voratum]
GHLESSGAATGQGAGDERALQLRSGGGRGREGLPLFPDLGDRGGRSRRSDAASHHG